jgi:hypothetical protein
LRVPAGEQVALPAQHGVGAYQQPYPTQHVHRQPVHQRGQQRPVSRLESHPPLAQLAVQHHDLVTQGKDLNVLVPVVHRQQTQHRERVGHAEVGQS